jgi:hypothetical protein
MLTMFRFQNLKGRDHLEDLGADGKILVWILETAGKMCTGFIWLRIRTSGGSCEHGK